MKIRVAIDPRRWSKRRRLAIFGIAGLLAVALPIAWASDRFSDVPTTNPHHADINTIARAGITTGCGTGIYCPEDPVSRQQMASFLARSLRAVTPQFLQAESSGTIDFDANPVVCQTTTHTPTVAKHARVDAWLSANSASSGLMAFTLRTVRSTDGGVTWIDLESQFSRGGRVTADEWAHANQMGRLDLVAGTSYRFGLMVGREAGTLDATESRCEVLVQITYRDAGASTLGIEAEPSEFEVAPAEVGVSDSEGDQ